MTRVSRIFFCNALLGLAGMLSVFLSPAYAYNEAPRALKRAGFASYDQLYNRLDTIAQNEEKSGPSLSTGYQKSQIMLGLLMQRKKGSFLLRENINFAGSLNFAVQYLMEANDRLYDFHKGFGLMDEGLLRKNLAQACKAKDSRSELILNDISCIIAAISTTFQGETHPPRSNYANLSRNRGYNVNGIGWFRP